MSAQHTPGPWSRNIRAGGKYPIIFAGRNQHVAQVCQQKDAAETEANIDLIAAAPALLAALKDMVCRASPVLESNCAELPNGYAVPTELTELENSLRFARAAIAAATAGEGK